MEDDELHLALHREADDLGKFATQMRIAIAEEMDRQRAESFLKDLLLEITQACFDHGADLVGHVKAFLRSPSGSISASLIDLKKQANVTNEFGLETGFREAEVTLHVIVHGIWDPEVRTISLEAIDRVCQRYGVDHTILKDYYETEKGIAHHQKK